MSSRSKKDKALLGQDALQILEKNQSKYKDQINEMNLISMIFVFFMMIIGGVLTYLSWRTDEKVQTTPCKSTLLKTSNKIILCLGIAIFTASIAFFTCNTSCGNKIAGFNYKYYIIILLILGITLITLASIIINEEKKEECQIKTGNPGIILGLGIFIVVACITYFIYEMKLISYIAKKK
jgi:hypothetical protein